MKTSSAYGAKALLTLFALFSACSDSVQADSWLPRQVSQNRYNGQACNYYFRSPSVVAKGYSDILSYAVTQWRGLSGKVDERMLVTGTNAYGRDNVVIKTKILDTQVLGETWVYIKSPTNIIKQGQDAYKDLKWEYCKVAIYDSRIAEWSNKTQFPGQIYYYTTRRTLVHEIGHTLKMAHPGEGTQRIKQLEGQDSIMEYDSVENIISDQPTLVVTTMDYDESEIKLKWGN